LFLCRVTDKCSVAFSRSAGNQQGTTDGLAVIDDEKMRLGCLNGGLNEAELKLIFATDICSNQGVTHFGS
jgi:hypothetical protein